MLKAVPIELTEANAFVEMLHRHHAPVRRDKFRIGCTDETGTLHGVIQVGNPVARMLCDGKTLEVVRCCSDGSENVCSFLYSRAARVAKELGYEKIITYILQSELGTSLKASGWHMESADCGGGSWNAPSRPREEMPGQISLFGDKPKYPTEKKQRWAKMLTQED